MKINEFGRERRLSFEKPKGNFWCDGIPYRIIYELSCSTNSKIDPKNPGIFMLTPIWGLRGRGGYTLTIWVHESVPANYRDIVMYHELIEAKLEFSKDLSDGEPHRRPVIKTSEYARAHLSPKELKEFLKWQRTLESY